MPQLPNEMAEYFLSAVDERAPDLVTGLYFHGSLVYGDFWPQRSDVDFVSVLSRRPGPEDVAVLRAAHGTVAARYPRPHFDGSHLVAADLAGPPDACPDVPGSLESVFESRSRFALSPVTWHELAGGGLTVRGPALPGVPLWTDQAALLAFTRGNLRSYWLTRLDRLRTAPADRAANVFAVQWFVLGVTRLHHLLATGRLTSKSGAGHYALEVFGERWHPIVSEALRLRSTGAPPTRPADAVADDNREYTAMVIESALAL